MALLSTGVVTAISRRAKIVLMDEPTSSLSEHEIRRLFRAISLLKKKGVTILYTTHKLEEISVIADHVAVLRDGILIRHCRADETDQHFASHGRSSRQSASTTNCLTISYVKPQEFLKTLPDLVKRNLASGNYAGQ